MLLAAAVSERTRRGSKTVQNAMYLGDNYDFKNGAAAPECTMWRTCDACGRTPHWATLQARA